MEKKNLYMVQVDHLYGNEEKSIYLPYAAGLLAAYALADPEVAEHYELKGFVFMRQRIDEAAAAMESPFLVGFSCYVWNTEYNKALARKIKQLHPGCVTVFGGHNVPNNTLMLEQCAYIDVLVHGEGEEAFKALLSAYAGSGDLAGIHNISFRNSAGEAIKSNVAPVADIDLPSPYLDGIFESLVNNGHFNFCAVIETNRGCPNHCTYCDWGRLSQKFKMFPLDKVLKEIDWMAEHKIEYFWCADSSFGLFKRDMIIIDRLIEKKLKTGYPKVFKANYAERREVEVYEICRKLNAVDMNKGATLSFQSLDPTVLKNINRENITMDRFAEMMALYNDAQIATYAELILGLPGETYESFRRGIETLLEAGQHNALNLHALVLLPNSQMANPEYMKKFGIQTVKTEFLQFHCEKTPDDIPEYYDLVVSTDSMDSSMWIQSMMFFIFLQNFHQLGLLHFFAIYLHYENKVKYYQFYDKLLDWSKTNKHTLCGEVYIKFYDKLAGVPLGKGSRSYTNPIYGHTVWPLEEAVFLDILPALNRFYKEIEAFLSQFGIEENIYSNLLAYQKGMLKHPNKYKSEIVLEYDFHHFFRKIYIHSHEPLMKRKNTIHAVDKKCAKSWKEYAVENIWYGRNDSRDLFSDITIEYND